MTPAEAAGTWTPDSWKSRPAQQHPAYDDPAALDDAVARLAKLPPLVTSWEIERLKSQLAAAARGERFLLQGGDCSETFEDCAPDAIASKLKILLQMSLVVSHGGGRPVVRVGRFGGQYAKPRSAPTETQGGVTLPTFRGDMVNRPGFTAAERRPDPSLILRGYERAALTVNFIRSLIDGGFADLHHPEYWELRFPRDEALRGEYHRIVESIGRSLRLVESLTGRSIPELTRVDFFTSHEGLLLEYEAAQTRVVPRRSGWWDLTTHFPWIGNRTRALGGAHVEFFRGIRNPVAVKIDASCDPAEAVELCRVLDPAGEPGRLTFILRFGADTVVPKLPAIVDAVRREGRTVLWCCDPMHGNTETTASGIKTRRFERMTAELAACSAVLRDAGVPLGGVHVEMTGENVTECVGGACGVTEADLSSAYRSQVDPRLNYEQALEMALLLARLVKG